MPTLDLAGPGGFRLRGSMLSDSDGKVRGEVFQILDLIREADVILGTGHLSVRESLQLTRLARERRVRKVLVTHPDAAFIGMPLPAQIALRDQGAFFERCYNGFAPGDGDGAPLAQLAATIRKVGMESTVLSTDYGQAEHPAPPVGLRAFLAGLLEEGFMWAQLQRMAGENPAGLLGL